MRRRKKGGDLNCLDKKNILRASKGLLNPFEEKKSMRKKRETSNGWLGSMKGEILKGNYAAYRSTTVYLENIKRIKTSRNHLSMN